MPLDSVHGNLWGSTSRLGKCYTALVLWPRRLIAFSIASGTTIPAHENFRLIGNQNCVISRRLVGALEPFFGQIWNWPSFSTFDGYPRFTIGGAMIRGVSRARSDRSVAAARNGGDMEIQDQFGPQAVAAEAKGTK